MAQLPKDPFTVICWGRDFRPLEEQQGLLAAELFLSPCAAHMGVYRGRRLQLKLAHETVNQPFDMDAESQTLVLHTLNGGDISSAEGSGLSV